MIEERVKLVKKKIFAFSAYCVMAIFVLPASSSMMAVLMKAVFQLMLVVVVLYLFNQRIISIPLVFLALSTLFNFGHVFLEAFNLDEVQMFNPLGYANGKFTFDALNYAVRLHYMIFLGYLLYSLRDKTIPLTNNKLSIFHDDNVYKEKTIIALAKLFFIISVVPTVGLDLYKVYLSLVGGYGNTFLALPGIFGIFRSMFETSVFIGIMVCSKKRGRSLVMLCVFSAYNIMTMLSGGRISATISIVIAALIYVHFVVKTIKPSVLLLLILAAIVFLGTIAYIGANRFTASFSLFEWAKYVFTLEFAYKIFGEFGISLISLVKAFETFPNIVDYNYGLTYITSFINVLPNIGYHYLFDFSNVFIYNFPNHLHLGGSYIGELYFNFGQVGLIIVPILGAIFAWIERIMHKSVKSENYIKTVICLLFVVPALSWIRGYFGGFIRSIVYIGMMIVVFCYFYQQHIVSVERKKGIYVKQV